MMKHWPNLSRSGDSVPPALSRIAAARNLIVAVLCMAAPLCGCGRDGDKQASETAASYFPVAVGNQWTYKRTVFPENIQLIMNPDPTTEPRFSPTRESGEETYSVVSHNDQGFVVEGRDSKGSKVFSIFEPLDFFETETMAWRDMGMPNSLAYVETRTGRLWGRSASPRVMICLLTPDKSLERSGDPMKRKVTCLRSSALIAVPAGTFNDTLKNTITFVNPLLSQEFRTERIFAKGVGCVKETQFNAGGKITHQLELVAYKIAGDK